MYTYEIKELTPRDVREFIKITGGALTDPNADMQAVILSKWDDLVDLINSVVTITDEKNIKVLDIDELPFSELSVLFDEFKKGNDSFFTMLGAYWEVQDNQLNKELKQQTESVSKENPEPMPRMKSYGGST